MSLVHVERPAAGDPEGLLVLHHGRGADEQDLLGLADVLDPHRRLHVASPRAPLTLEDWPGPRRARMTPPAHADAASGRIQKFRAFRRAPAAPHDPPNLRAPPLALRRLEPDPAREGPQLREAMMQHGLAASDEADGQPALGVGPAKDVGEAEMPEGLVGVRAEEA